MKEKFTFLRQSERIANSTEHIAHRKSASFIIDEVIAADMVYPSGRVAGTLFFIGVAQFVISVIVAEGLTDGYSTSYNYLSDLGVGPFSLIFNSSIFLLGLLLIVGSYFLQRTGKFWVLTMPLVLMSIGAMGAGVFPEEAVHMAGAMHSISGVLFLLFGPLSAIASYKLLKMPLSLINSTLGVMGLAAFVLLWSNTHFGLGEGGMQRMIVYPFLMALIGFGCYLIANPEKTNTRET
jgi:hypothetical membrane protein